MMKILSSLKIAYRALKLHKARSGLTILGLVIGVTSIIVVMNMGLAIESFVIKQVEVFGADYINIEVKTPAAKKNSFANAASMAQGVSITTLKIEDAEAVGRQPNVRDYYVAQLGQSLASFQDERKLITLWGVSASFFGLHTAHVVEGRPFLDEEDKSLSRVVVIGHGLRKKFFGQGDAVGQLIKIGNKKFTVVGVMEEQGGFAFMGMDDVVYMPVRTLQKQVMGINHIQVIIAFLDDPNQADATAADLEDIMREQHGIADPQKEDFAVTTSAEALQILDTITGAITLLLIAIAAISLLVGGVGIMNIMYVSVTERTYEIGLRKAVGATRSNILWQFLWEAVFLTFAGGLIGVVLGTLFSLAATLGAKQAGIDWGFNFSWPGLVLAVGFSVLVGLVFGIYPAKKAGELQPVEALSQGG